MYRYGYSTRLMYMDAFSSGVGVTMRYQYQVVVYRCGFYTNFYEYEVDNAHVIRTGSVIDY